jgi:hypothetical protein
MHNGLATLRLQKFKKTNSTKNLNKALTYDPSFNLIE